MRMTHRGVHTLRGVNLTIRHGEFCVLLGSDTHGKAMLMACLAGVAHPEYGAIAIDGHLITRGHERPGVGAVLSSDLFDDSLTLAKNLLFAARLRRVKGDRRGAMEDICARLELTEVLDTPVRHLSVGLRRRAQLARALVHRPRFLVLDEPTAGIDPRSAELVWQTIILELRKGTSVLLSTGSTSVAVRAHTVAIMEDGLIVARGKPSTLLEKFDQESLGDLLQLLSHKTMTSELKGRYADEPPVALNRDIGSDLGHDTVTSFWDPHSGLFDDDTDVGIGILQPRMPREPSTPDPVLGDFEDLEPLDEVLGLWEDDSLEVWEGFNDLYQPLRNYQGPSIPRKSTASTPDPEKKVMPGRFPPILSNPIAALKKPLVTAPHPETPTPAVPPAQQPPTLKPPEPISRVTPSASPTPVSPPVTESPVAAAPSTPTPDAPAPRPSQPPAAEVAAPTETPNNLGLPEALIPVSTSQTMDRPKNLTLNFAGVRAATPHQVPERGEESQSLGEGEEAREVEPVVTEEHHQEDMAEETIHVQSSDETSELREGRDPGREEREKDAEEDALEEAPHGVDIEPDALEPGGITPPFDPTAVQVFKIDPAYDQSPDQGSDEDLDTDHDNSQEDHHVSEEPYTPTDDTEQPDTPLDETRLVESPWSPPQDPASMSPGDLLRSVAENWEEIDDDPHEESEPIRDTVIADVLADFPPLVSADDIPIPEIPAHLLDLSRMTGSTKIPKLGSPGTSSTAKKPAPANPSRPGSSSTLRDGDHRTSSSGEEKSKSREQPIRKKPRSFANHDDEFSRMVERHYKEDFADDDETTGEPDHTSRTKTPTRQGDEETFLTRESHLSEELSRPLDKEMEKQAQVQLAVAKRLEGARKRLSSDRDEDSL
ncbi:MAG: ATP-binding cassette domain-containing protein [Propionibacteriaceae bacterium]|nr:ATP-binding cassette domain-containing protein [Propionibacteriaceae bacterium]